MAVQKIQGTQIDQPTLNADNFLPTQTGNAGEFLTTDGTNISWAPGGGASPLTTKGDLYTYSTLDARLGVGTDGQVLTADSAEATGVKWATAAGGVTWATYTGTQATPTVTASSNNLALTFGNGNLNITQTGTPRGGLYAGGSITTSGTADRNIILWGGADTGGTATARTLTSASRIGSVIISPSDTANRTAYTRTVVIGAGTHSFGDDTVAIGAEARANNSGVSIGYQASALAGVAIGWQATTNSNSVAISGGTAAKALSNGNGQVVIASASTITVGTGYGNVLIGVANNTNTNNSAYTVAIGGNALFSPPASGVHGTVTVGVYNGADQSGSFNFAAGGFTTGNQAKASVLIGRMTTTSATPLEIGFPNTQATCQDATAPGGRIILRDNAAYIFDCDIVARQDTTGDTSAWNLKFAIKRGANAAATVLLGTPTATLIAQDAGASAWTVTVTADTTNGRPDIELTGEAAKTIRWVMNSTQTTVVG